MHNCRPFTESDCGDNAELADGSCVCDEGFERRAGSEECEVSAATLNQRCYDADFRAPIADDAAPGGCRAAEDDMADREACAAIDPDNFPGPGRYAGVLGGACAVVPTTACAGNGGRYHPDLFFDRSAGDDSVGVQDVGLCAVGTGCVGGISSRGISPGIVENNICRALTESDCGQYEEFTASGRGGTCAPRAAGDCPDNQEFMDAPDPADGGTCVRCEEHEFSTGGSACEECAANTFRVAGGFCIACGDDQVRMRGEASCSCREGYADDDTSTPELNCTETPACNGANEDLDMQTNSCVCTTGVRQQDGSCAPNIECNEDNQERDPATNMCRCESGNERQADNSCAPNIDCPDPNEARDASTNTCIASSDCTGEGMRIQGNGECEADIVCNEPNQERDPTDNTCQCEDGNDRQADNSCAPNIECNEDNQERDSATNMCRCVSGNYRQADGSCAESCADTEKILNGACVALTAADCLPAEKFETGMCVLLDPEDGASLIPPYGEGYTSETCMAANWPWSIVQTADGLSELCHAPVNPLASLNPSQTPDAVRTDFCVLRGATVDSVRCDDPTLFGSLGIPPAPTGLVTQITTAVTITLSDGAIREAATLTATVAGYLQAVHVSGSVAAIFPPNTTEAEITTADPLVGTISLEVSMSVTPLPATNTMTPPPATNAVAPPASGGGSSGGGGGAAAALIAVPVVLIGGYWLLGGFDFVDPTYNLSYSGENSDFSYRGDAGFDLNHGSLSSYARAIQSDGDAISYESGISYAQDFYSLSYAASESKSVYDYDLDARLTYGEGPWSISPTADAEFNYSIHTEDWTTDASAGFTAAWTSHKWNIRAHSAFAGDANHGLDLEYRF